MKPVGWAAVTVLAGLAVLVGTRVRIGEPAPVLPAAAPAVAVVVPPRRTVLVTPAGLLAVPVSGVARATITDSWLDSRGAGTRQHHGTDIMAPSGTSVTAAAPGTIEKLFQSRQGGTTLYERSADGQWVYYYAHLSGYAPGVHEGQPVKAGDPLGYVGDTGDAGPGNYHLHFGMTRMAPGQRWYQGENVNPYPMLAGKPSSR